VQIVEVRTVEMQITAPIEDRALPDGLMGPALTVGAGREYRGPLCPTACGQVRALK